MAFKKYAYYMRGNKLAILESETRSSSGVKAVAHCTVGTHTTKDACEAAGGQWIPSSGGSSIGAFEEYQSPVEDVADGLEIEYAYSPTYWTSDELRTQQNKFWVNGWVVKDGYLAFIRSHIANAPNWTSSPYSAVAAEEYILVKGSSRWNGLHKVRVAGTEGLLETYTRVHEAEIAINGSSNIDIGNEATVDGVSLSKINGRNSSNIRLSDIFSAGDYIVIQNTTSVNTGLWKVEKSIIDSDGTQEEDYIIYIKDKVYVPIATDADSGITSVEEEYVDTTPNTSAHNSNSMHILKAYRDHCYIVSDVNVMEDESFELDLPSYVQKAIVYYLKARVAEDKFDLEQKEYFMREFHKMIDKYDNSLVTTIRQMQAPKVGIR